MDFLKLFSAGGFVMYPLLFCSVLVWAILIDKVRKFSLFNRQIINLMEKAKQLICERKIDEARGLGHNMNNFVKAPYLLLFDEKCKSREEKEGKIARRLDESRLELAKANWLLATIATVAPFLGLLGTVVGIIRSFESIANSGKSGFSVIAPGLAEALITTAAGILVAIMALSIFNYFQMRLKKMVVSYRIGLEDLLDDIRE